MARFNLLPTGFFLFIALFNLSFKTKAQSITEEADRTESPYFLILNKKADVEAFPLKLSAAEVNIAGVIADVTITQVYQNTSKHVIEAVYVFPASTRAAVYSMKMTVGKKQIEARIKEKEEARDIYEEAKSEGKTASLLEQQRPNVFQMNVANILPGDSIIINMSYTELLVPENGIYEFVYPTVVGPRYTGEKAALTNDDDESKASKSKTPKWSANPHTTKGTLPTYDFDIKLNIQAGLPISEVESPTHKIQAVANSAEDIMVELDPSEAKGGNRDFILRYSLRDKQIQSGMLATKAGKENFFLYMIQPPKRTMREMVTKREYIFVVDVSGSMSGFPLGVSKELLSNLIGSLNEDDLFNVILFAGGSELLSRQSLKANKSNIKKAINVINHQSGGGGTNLYAAMENALSLKSREGYAKTVVICTDGYVNVEPEVFTLIRKNLDKTNVFAFGIGTSVNRHIIEGMAYIGKGEPFVAIDEMEAQEAAKRFKEYIEAPVLTDIKVDFGEMDVFDVEPLTIPDLFADRPIIVQGKYKGNLSGSVKLTGISGGQEFQSITELEKVKPYKQNRALRHLWARERIRILGDYQGLVFAETRKKAITDLGLKYNLLTDYTSFVAVYKKNRTEQAADSTIRQLLPLPKGIPNSAIASQGIVSVNANKFGSVQTLECVVVVSNTSCLRASENACSFFMTSEQRSFPTSPLIFADFKNYQLQRSQYLIQGLPLNNSLGRYMGIQHLPLSWMRTITRYYDKLKVENGLASPYGTLEADFWNAAYNNDLEVDMQASHLGELEGDFKGVYRFNQKWAGKLLLNTEYMGAKWDLNNDNFWDVPLSQKYRVMNSWKVDKQSYLSALQSMSSEFGVYYSYLDFQEGEKGLAKNESTRYKAGTTTRNLALFAKTSLRFDPGIMYIDIVGGMDKQEGSFGVEDYDGSVKALWTRMRFKAHDINGHGYEFGVAYHAEDYEEQLVDLKQDRLESVIGAFGKYSFSKRGFMSEVGLRADYHNSFNWLVSPSVDVHYSWKNMLFFMAGVNRKYRVPKALAENIEYAFSARKFILTEDIQPEESWNFNAGVNYNLHYNFSIGAAYERVQFGNRLVTDLDNPGEVRLYNLDGRSYVNRISTSMTCSVRRNFQMNLRYQFEDFTTTYDDGKQRKEPFISQHRLFASLTYKLIKANHPNWVFNLAGQLFGKQRIPETTANPEGSQLPKHSPNFFLLDARVTKHFKQWRIYVGAENILNYKVEDPIIAADQPFGDNFDGSLIWGPVVGARVYTGVVFELK